MFKLKYESSIHNIAFSSEKKVILSESGGKICTDQAPFKSKKPVQN